MRLAHWLLVQGHHTCPWWFGYTFDNPLRRLLHDPSALLGGLVRPGDTVLDLGCGLGYFTVGLAELVGPGGRVIAVDIQPAMLRRAARRVRRRGLADRVTFHQAGPEAIGLTQAVDFALAFWMLHEVRDREAFLAEAHALLRPGGRLLVAEPLGHVPEPLFAREVAAARAAGFTVEGAPRVRLSRSLLARRP